MIFIETLEFDSFKNFLKENFSSIFAINYLSKLKPYSKDEDILKNQQYFREIFDILSKNNSLKIPSDEEYHEFYVRLKDPHAVFTVEDFVTFKNFHKSTNELKKEILENEGVMHLKDITTNIHSFSDIISIISDKISDDAKVKDSASNLLYEIREKLREVRKQLTLTINKIFARKDADKFIQERVIKEYNNRYVLLCKTNFKQYIGAIVHSTSGSGQTLYIEPNELIQLNNLYQELSLKEEREVKHILKEILGQIRSKIYEIVEMVESFSKLSFLLNTAVIYNKYTYCLPEIANEILFEDIFHPLILFSRKDEAVPISLEMKENINLTIITGPNTGGKTAALKTIGLNTIISKCGMPLFGRYAKFINFNNILADIGDNQSLIMSLSTFSSHILNIKNILELADSNSLVLLDEIGTGTEPTEGAALALGTLMKLKEKKSKVIVTTHFSDIKSYGLKRGDCEIYSVDFDYQTFESSYKLLKGVVGKSSPIIIAKKLKYDADAIKYAEDYLSEKISDKEVIFEELNLKKAEIEREKIDLLEKKRILNSKEEEIKRREQELREKLEINEIKLLEETYLLLNKAKNINANKRLKEDDKVFVNKNIEKVKDKLESLKEKKSIKDKLEVGDNIFLDKYKKIAKILEIKKDKVLVDLEGLKVTLKKNELIGKKIHQNSTKSVKIKRDVKNNAKSEIVVIGKTVEEAVDIIEQSIDKALLANMGYLYIVHGRGSGALRKGIQEYLRGNSLIKSFRIAENSEGGQAVTVVEL